MSVLRPTPWRRRGGFTLIELIVGLVIATFIMGSAAIVFVTTMDNWDRGKREQRILQTAQTTADLIERYLRCATPPGKTYGTFTGEDLSSEDVDGHRLTFLSTAEGRFPRSVDRGDLSEIEFCYDPDEDRMTMRIDSTPDEDPTAGGYRVQLSALIQAFRVMYFDGFEWVTEWTDSTTLPMAVEFHLIIGDPSDVAEDGSMRTREISRLVWLPMGKRPPEATGPLDGSADPSQPPQPYGGGGQ